MDQILSQILSILRGSWRYRWIAIAIAWVGCLVAWPYVISLPNKYEASARVFVDPKTALKPVIDGLAIQQDVGTELALVRQTLLSTPHLGEVAETIGILSPSVTGRERNWAIDGLRGRIDISVQTQPTGDVDQAGSKVYAIHYQDVDRDRALRLVQLLLESFREDTLGGKRQASAAAQKFLESQIKEYGARLNESDQRLADFKKRNVGMVPGDQAGDYFSRMQAETDAMKKVQADLNIAYARRNALNQQLRGEAPVAAATGMPSTPGSPSQGDTLSRIKETQAKLEDMLLHYTEKHPDVIALRETLEQLKARRAGEIEALKRGDAGAAAATGASSNPVYQSIQLQLNQTDVDIAAKRGELAMHQDKVAELRKMVDTMPQVEAEFASLNRDYSVTKAQYTALVERLEKARLGDEAEASGSIRFEVIDPPAVGFTPVSPRRPIMLLAVLAASLAAGAGIAYLLNLLRPVFHDVRELTELTGARVLGSISVSRSGADAYARRRGYLAYSFACVLLVGAFVIAVFIGRAVHPVVQISGS